MKDPNIPELFVGKSQQDYGEPDTFDGTIWALPTAQDRLDEAGGGPEADIFQIASGVSDEGDAQRLVNCWNFFDDLLLALEDMVAGYEDTLNRYGHGAGDVVAARAVISKARGGESRAKPQPHP